MGYVVQSSSGKLTLCVNKTPVSFTYGNKKLTYTADVDTLAAGAVIDTGTMYTDVNGNCGVGSIVLVTKDGDNWIAFSTGKVVKQSGVGSVDPSQLQDQMKAEMEKMMQEAMAGMMGGLNFGNFGSYGMYAGAGQATGPQLFDLKGTTLMTITEQEVMTLTVAIDEHDIAKVSLGQIADVEVTALKGEVFEAEVTEIGNYGTNNGGSSKFSVELTMDADPRMLGGMNAAALIPMFTKMEIVTIPVAALVETPQGTVVYTALDQKTGEPTAPVAVETGLSDGENVEIISGIDPGQKVYYSFYNVLELDHTAKNEYDF